MTLDEIKIRVARIKEFSVDPELAHGDEDDLRHMFILEVARMCTDERIKEMARAVLETDKFDFCRWCA